MAEVRTGNAKTHFHLGLLAVFAPGIGALLTVALAFAHRRSNDPWARGLAWLAGADVLVVAALVVLAARGGLEQAPSTAPSRPMVGIQLDERSRVSTVMPRSPAEEAGLKVGDRLLRIDGAVAGSPKEALERLRGLRSGAPAVLTVARGEGEVQVTVLPRPVPRARPALFEAVPTGAPPPIGWMDLVPFAVAGLLAAWTARRGGTSPPVWPEFFLILIGSVAVSAGAAWLLASLLGGVSIGILLLAMGMQPLAFAAGVEAAGRLRPFTPPAPADPMPSGKAVLLGLFYLATLLPRAGVLVALLLSAPAEGMPRPEDPVGRLASAGLPPAGLILLAIDVVLLAPLGEEMLFRGLLLPRLAARLNPAWAVLATALLFASLHTQYGVQSLVLFVHGVVLGWARLRTGRLVAPVALHMTANAVALGVAVLGSG